MGELRRLECRYWYPHELKTEFPWSFSSNNQFLILNYIHRKFSVWIFFVPKYFICLSRLSFVAVNYLLEHNGCKFCWFMLVSWTFLTCLLFRYISHVISSYWIILQIIEFQLPSFFNNFDPRATAANFPSSKWSFLLS